MKLDLSYCEMILIKKLVTREQNDLVRVYQKSTPPDRWQEVRENLMRRAKYEEGDYAVSIGDLQAANIILDKIKDIEKKIKDNLKGE